MTTPSPTFERILAGSTLTRRTRQDQAVTLAHAAVTDGRRVLVQAPTGVGKSLVALATAADAGRPGAPGIVVTTTNALGEQYLRDAAAVADRAGFTFTRVMGAAHYACADSPGARADGVPYPIGLDDDEQAKMRDARNAWLDGCAALNPATAFEWRAMGLTADYRCDGYPRCHGATLGGCGSKAARRRGFDVDVVISNFHLLGFAHRFPDARLLPLGTAAVVVVDEAHRLPDVIAEIDGGQLTARTGSRAFADVAPELLDPVSDWIVASLDAVVWPGDGAYDTEARVPPTAKGLAEFLAAWSALSPAMRAVVEGHESPEPGEFGAGDVISLVRNWWRASDPRSGWVAWTTRQRTGFEWTGDATITVRRVSAAADIVPALLPAAAVLMTGTVGRTLPVRLGLVDAELHDLGQEFDWSTVRGTISRHHGAQSSRVPREVREARDVDRVRELADAIGHHGGALVLANSRLDAVRVGDRLDALLPGHRVLVARRGGSLAAAEVANGFVATRRAGWAAVLVGVDSFATGLDLPGDLCTFVAWWVCVPSATGLYDTAVGSFFAAAGDYRDEQFRARFTQGLGRLLRSSDDRGEVMVCDNRAVRHLDPHRLGRVDRHLAEIDWSIIPAPSTDPTFLT